VKDIWSPDAPPSDCTPLNFFFSNRNSAAGTREIKNRDAMRDREPVSDIEGEEFVVKLLASDELVSLARRHLAAGTSPIIPQKSPVSPPKKSPLFPQKKFWI